MTNENPIKARVMPAQTHCSECTRGGNGDKSCGAGWMVTDKRGDNRFRMCFAGTKLQAKGGEE